jgi:DNA-directed RNA polymerase specialized sigma24 family protein
MGDTTLLQSWLDRLGANDPAARAQLLHHSYNRLRRLTHQMLRRFARLRQYEQTSDVLHNVLIRLDRALQTSTLATARDYLRVANTIIRNELIDRSRHFFGPEGAGAHVQALDSDAPPPDPSCHTDDPANLAVWREIHEYIDGRPAEEREMFELVYYQGLKLEDAAGVMEMPLTTFKTHWRNARIRFMERFENQSPFDSE